MQSDQIKTYHFATTLYEIERVDDRTSGSCFDESKQRFFVRLLFRLNTS